MRQLDEDIFLFTPADWRAMPWRNGGGITHEIFAQPPGADFDWRLSVADVASDGPFSSFPGVARSIMLLEGDGMRLRIDGADILLDEPHRPLDFSGESETHCTLTGGPVRDFNIMSRRARLRHAHRVIDAFPVSAAGNAAVLALFCLHGRVDTLCAGRPAMLARADTLVLLSATHRLGRLDAGVPGSRALLVQFTPA